VIVVLGVTGHTGSETARLLVAQGEQVRGVTRDPERAAQLPSLAGVDLVAGDSSVPESLAGVFDGASAVYLVPPTELGWDGMQAAIIAAAAGAGVGHMVKLSAMGAGPDEPSMSLSYHWKGEQQIEASGMSFTHIRPNSFFQNTLFDIATLQSEGRFYSCVGEAPFAKIDTRDIAAVVALALTDSDQHAGRTYELTGPEALTYPDLALSADTYSAVLRDAGLPDWMAAEFSDIYGRGYYREGHGARVTDTVATVLGRAPRTFDAFAAEYADTLRRSPV
jgi:uncharacterized protein YbjT (DUF2867 family)